MSVCVCLGYCSRVGERWNQILLFKCFWLLSSHEIVHTIAHDFHNLLTQTDTKWVHKTRARARFESIKDYVISFIMIWFRFAEQSATKIRR